MINFMLGCLNVIDLQNTVISAKVNSMHGKYCTELKRLKFVRVIVWNLVNLCLVMICSIKNPSYFDNNYKRGTNTVYRKILGRANADYQNMSKALVSNFILGSNESNFQVLLQTFALHLLSFMNTEVVLKINNNRFHLKNRSASA